MLFTEFSPQGVYPSKTVLTCESAVVCCKVVLGATGRELGLCSCWGFSAAEKQQCIKAALSVNSSSPDPTAFGSQVAL